MAQNQEMQLIQIIRNNTFNEQHDKPLEFNLNEPLSPVKPASKRPREEEPSILQKIANGSVTTTEVVECLANGSITFNDMKCMFDTTSTGPFYLYVDQVKAPLMASYFLVDLLKDESFDAHQLFSSDVFGAVFKKYLRFMYGTSKSHLQELNSLLQCMRERKIAEPYIGMVSDRIQSIEKEVVKVLQCVFCAEDVESYVFRGQTEHDIEQVAKRLAEILYHINHLADEGVLILPGTVESLFMGYSKCFCMYVREMLLAVDINYGEADLYNMVDSLFGNLGVKATFTLADLTLFQSSVRDWNKALDLLTATESNDNLKKRITICKKILEERLVFAEQLFSFCENESSSSREILWPFLPGHSSLRLNASVADLYSVVRIGTFLKKPDMKIIERNILLLAARFDVMDNTDKNHRRLMYGDLWIQLHSFFKNIRACLADVEKSKDLSMLLPVCYVKSMLPKVVKVENNGLAQIYHRMKMCNLAIRNEAEPCECNSALDIAISAFRYIHEDQSLLRTEDALRAMRKDVKTDTSDGARFMSRNHTVTFLKSKLANHQYLAVYSEGETHTVKADCGLLFSVHNFNLVQLYLSTLMQFDSRPKAMDLEVAACLRKLGGVFELDDEKGCIRPDCYFRRTFRRLGYNVWGTINRLRDLAQKCVNVPFDMSPLTPTFEILRDEWTCLWCQNLAIMLFQVAYVIEN